MMKPMMMTMAAAMLMGAQQAPNLIAPGKALAIGPKQDDPRAVCGDAGSAKGGIIVQGGRGIVVQGGRGIIVQGGRETIGPKQDDPRTAVVARPGDDNDPKASGGAASGGNLLAIGPKQDDPLAIGPKQDDPRARAKAGFDPETDPAARMGCKAKLD